MNVKFICTGGTIDSYYNTDECTALPLEKSSIPEFLKKVIKIDMNKLSFIELYMKDSREINNIDRDNIIDIIEKSDEKCYVITHGTFTLFETAKYIEQKLKRKDAIITLTGALIPLTGFSPNDAGFNLGMAILNSRINKAGVYVSINGNIFNADSDIKLH